jgi:predicted ribonuclease toxin of YeeF-YezG toxin-antitoxin module
MVRKKLDPNKKKGRGNPPSKTFSKENNAMNEEWKKAKRSEILAIAKAEEEKTIKKFEPAYIERVREMQIEEDQRIQNELNTAICLQLLSLPKNLREMKHEEFKKIYQVDLLEFMKDFPASQGPSTAGSIPSNAFATPAVAHGRSKRGQAVPRTVVRHGEILL